MEDLRAKEMVVEVNRPTYVRMYVQLFHIERFSREAEEKRNNMFHATVKLLLL